MLADDAAPRKLCDIFYLELTLPVRDHVSSPLLSVLCLLFPDPDAEAGWQFNSMWR